MEKLIHKATGELITDDPFLRVGQKVETKEAIRGLTPHWPGIVTRLSADQTRELPPGSAAFVWLTRTLERAESRQASPILRSKVEAVDDWSPRAYANLMY